MIERLWQGAAIVVVGKTDLDDLEKRLEAAELTIGTLQADRIKVQATIDHYRTMLARELTLPRSIQEALNSGDGTYRP